MRSIRADLNVLSLGLATIAAVTVLYLVVLHVAHSTIIAASFLLIVLGAAARSRFWVAGVLSVIAMLVSNFFFIPPVGTLTVADPQNWLDLFAFLAVGLIGSSLSAAARARAELAIKAAQLRQERRSADTARQGEALKTALLASVAHDLKTPLTAIQVAAGNLQDGRLGRDEQRAQAEIVLSEVTRLSGVFEDILQMARIEAGALAAAREWVPASEIVNAARTHAEPALRRHRLDVEDAVAAMVQLDPRLTSAALAHVLTNAARYSPAGSRIAVATSLTEQGLQITVRDHGTGIPAADLPHVFDSFYRGANSRQTPGSGMGLAIARGLLAAQNGRVHAENCRDGGAQFTVFVPAASRTGSAAGG